MLFNDSFPNHLSSDFRRVKQDFWAEIREKEGVMMKNEKRVSSLGIGKGKRHGFRGLNRKIGERKRRIYFCIK